MMKVGKKWCLSLKNDIINRKRLEDINDYEERESNGLKKWKIWREVALENERCKYEAEEVKILYL